ncbi:hypothetical protein BESB_024120 [Besnoitia besnoiti]|uniref:Uncharacterized protein n=1 Tax=Besnoitia besnoiti TaxID=94643 RepID=A0A2A9M961_BESBE|nr:hypothetical protein BESB_024120 [Besnoitia besnoiti]PFH31920.1 hypothetical protein BESB_024120 [Besnoitia besnoiti]
MMSPGARAVTHLHEDGAFARKTTRVAFAVARAPDTVAQYPRLSSSKDVSEDPCLETRPQAHHQAAVSRRRPWVQIFEFVFTLGDMAMNAAICVAMLLAVTLPDHVIGHAPWWTPTNFGVAASQNGYAIAEDAAYYVDYSATHASAPVHSKLRGTTSTSPQVSEAQLDSLSGLRGQRIQHRFQQTIIDWTLVEQREQCKRHIDAYAHTLMHYKSTLSP